MLATLTEIWKVFLGMLVGLLLSPIVLVVKLLLWPFTYEGVNMSAETVAGYLRNELAGGGNDNFRWEDLEQTKIRDPFLESVRKQAISVAWPLSSADRQKLEALLNQLSPESN
jgi:hypothetical protein